MSQIYLTLSSGVIPPSIATSFVTNSGTATPTANVLNILGTTVAAGTIPFQFTGTGNTVTGQIQLAQAIASTNITAPGLASFNSADFSVDANGFVTLTAGSAAIMTITGDSGGALGPTLGNFNFSGGSTGLNFNGAISTETLTGTLTLGHGGTSAALTASNGGIFYSTATAGAILSGTATAKQMLQSGASTTPAWSTSTWPATTTINQLLYSSSANTITGLATANNGVLITGTTGVPSILAAGTTGQVLSATTGSPPSWQSAAASGIVTIDGNTGSITGTTVTFNGTTTLSGASVSFQGSGSTMSLHTSDTNANTFIGSSSGNTSLSGTDNAGFGTNTLKNLTSGSLNVGVGFGALQVLTTGNDNVGLGDQALGLITTGISNIAIGTGAGLGYSTGSESSNIVIGNAGTSGESNVIRMGTPGQQNQCFIAGIVGVTVSNTELVTINSSTGQMGVTSALGVSNGGTGNTSQPAYSLVCGGTTTTGAFQAVSDVATGSVLISKGTSALPAFSAFPQISGLGIGASPGSTAGLTFDGTNFLSVYSTGTWTPGIAFGGASAGVTYSVQNGGYTKIGNVLNYYFTLQTSALGSSTGALSITGWPFTFSAASSNGATSCSYFLGLTITNYTDVAINPIAATTTAQVILSGSAVAPAFLTKSQMSATTLLSVSGTFII
jgi:hypothetical protein